VASSSDYTDSGPCSVPPIAGTFVVYRSMRDGKTLGPRIMNEADVRPQLALMLSSTNHFFMQKMGQQMFRKMCPTFAEEHYIRGLIGGSMNGKECVAETVIKVAPFESTPAVVAAVRATTSMPR